MKPSTARRACALLAAFLVGGFTCLVLFYGSTLVFLVAAFILFGTRSGCVPSFPPWLESLTPGLLLLILFLTLASGVCVGAFFRNKVLRTEWYP